MIHMRKYLFDQVQRIMGLEKKKFLALLNEFSLEESLKNNAINEINNANFEKNIKNIFNFLSFYKGGELIPQFETFLNSLSTNGIPFTFYIYFMYIYFIRQGDSTNYEKQFVHNLSLLFYSLDVEAIYNTQKFREHFKNAYLDDAGIEHPLDEILILEIKREIPPYLKDPLDLAIAIYILLCKNLCYSPEYILEQSSRSFPKYWEVNFKNNHIVCYTFSIIYYKLLKLFGIDANLTGDSFSHMKVNLRIRSMMLEADATWFGRKKTSEYKVSDMANVKYGFSLSGFKLASLESIEKEYINYNQRRLEESIDKVSNLFYQKDNAIKIATILYERNFLLRKLKKERKVSLEEEMDFQIKTLNQIFSFLRIEGECEHKQILSKFKDKLFSSYSMCTVNTSLLYKKAQEEVRFYTLFKIGVGEESFYYLETDEGIKKYDLSLLKDAITLQQLMFKDEEKNDLLWLSSNNKKKIKKIQ